MFNVQRSIRNFQLALLIVKNDLYLVYHEERFDQETLFTISVINGNLSLHNVADSVAFVIKYYRIVTSLPLVF